MPVQRQPPEPLEIMMIEDLRECEESILTTWVANFRRGTAAQSRGDSLLNALRACALELRQEQPRPFYTARRIAKAFGVSLSVVSDVFGRLQQEGVLRVARGAQTVIEGTNADRSAHARGIVGLVFSLRTFVTFRPHRTFFVKLRQSLRHKGFIRDILFLEGSELEEPQFRARAKSWSAAILFLPDASMRNAALTLTDHGVRVIAVGDESFSSVPCQYRVVRSEAVATGLLEWRSHGIQPVAAVSPAFDSSVLRNELVADLVREAGTEAAYTHSNSSCLSDYLEALMRIPDAGVVFPQAAFAQFICQRAPEKLFELMRAKRVMFVSGPPTIQFVAVPPAPVDLIRVDWENVVERMVKDLDHVGPLPPEQGRLFHANWLPQVPLNRFTLEY